MDVVLGTWVIFLIHHILGPKVLIFFSPLELNSCLRGQCLQPLMLFIRTWPVFWRQFQTCDRVAPIKGSVLASEDNFGLGVTSSAWLSSQPALHLRDLPAAKPTTALFGLSPELGVAAASVRFASAPIRKPARVALVCPPPERTTPLAAAVFASNVPAS